MGDGNGCNEGEKERFPSEVPSNFSAVVVQLALVPMMLKESSPNC